MKKRKNVIAIVLIAVILLDAAVIGLTVKEYLDTTMRRLFARLRQPEQIAAK